MSQKWYRGTDGWEEGYEFIDLGYDGDFIAYRRQISDGQIIYEGDFRDAGTGEKMPAFLDVIVDWDGQWMQYWIMPHDEEQK